jgi:D-alanyl-D-alanine endopeptidase (penicillin-binding protein 7)
MKKILMVFLCSFLFINTAFSKVNHHSSHQNKVRVVKQYENGSPKSYLLFDVETGEELAGINIDKVRPMASLTKLMTAYVLLNNHPNIDTCSAKITEEDTDTKKHTSTKLDKYTEVSCKKLLQVMLVASDNYAASALSRSIPGMTQDEFINLMNQQAKNWGMSSTFYDDPSGLSYKNVSMAKDLAILITKMLTNPLIREYSSSKEVLFVKNNNHILTLKNSNRLIREMDYNASLSKTGFINESGYNLIFVPREKCNSKEVGVVILGANSSVSRSSFANSILNKFGCSKS